ncbi:uncharacterized protein EI90DRAFT_148177 [Cantharellus anzutake]|uniref:uncharacterized protein n=1 Tax=Cantharellus anzutake TaxID=1750568 RepID=UPI001907B1F3|nr:uncharacterized protein EI90DRAFT_148177 [Cantharellus anzutake]KAF8317499.1 hypothetical protein EI90DRAFT_148177 [Cantharellus anzutake]
MGGRQVGLLPSCSLRGLVGGICHRCLQHVLAILSSFFRFLECVEGFHICILTRSFMVILIRNVHVDYNVGDRQPVPRIGGESSPMISSTLRWKTHTMRP